ncbi:MAG: hypothetical protein IRY92_07875 [Dactylosporangium sp.]|nr:hypothetical protein [Dactylosporangium sp.]
MTLVKVRHDGNSTVITVPSDLAKKLNLEIGSHVQVTADEQNGCLIVAPVAIRPRARRDYREASRRVIERHRGLYKRLERYDRGESE